MAFRRRDELLDNIVSVFSEQPEVREITLFGSNADASTDRYSDIDIRIHSNDLLCTQKNYLQLISSISPIFETLVIQSDNYNMAQMIMLKGFSPYHKIDFGICSGSSVFTPSRSIYKNDNAIVNDTELQILPITEDVKYNLDYQLFRVPRITKCFFRKDSAGYKKWNETVDLVLSLLFEKYHTYKKISQKIEFSKRRIRNLYGRLNAEDKDAFDRILPYSGEINLVDSYLAALKMMILISKEKADNIYMKLNEEFILFIENFCELECNKLNEDELLREYWKISLNKADNLFCSS